jgi:hypothetical protein
MANRTYTPTLRILTHAIIKFVARYRVQIDKNLTAPQRALLDTLLNAAQALASALPEPIPTN